MGGEELTIVGLSVDARRGSNRHHDASEKEKKKKREKKRVHKILRHTFLSAFKKYSERGGSKIVQHVAL
jgi:hypothetical protein